ncbi:MAG: penicillin-binding transpeptidase domain-containing protein [Candidatus Pacebacteria bacterium]|nr:penicillin-binding transpeptidase domain-containing protein [Candidatus Paceibacterota bacterium]
MFRSFRRSLNSKKYLERTKDIDPDEIFIDSENLPNFDVNQFEGRLEKSISRNTFIFFAFFCFLIFILFFYKSWNLQITEGDNYYQRSENNRLRNTLIFSKRGVVSDRKDRTLVWNILGDDSLGFSLRKYATSTGLSHIMGYLKYPQKDKYGFYYNEDFVGKDGIEKFYNNELAGENGLRIVEVDALNNKKSENTIRPPKDGKDIKLSIDSKLQGKLYDSISDLSGRVGFTGGAGVIMDVNTGEILALTSFPEYDSQVMTDGTNKIAINNFLNNKNNPFLDRVTDGLYTPGSIVKPFMAVAALCEKIIGQYDNILSTGALTIPNPYDPSKPTVFKDWKAHGYVDMRKAISVSSDVYFYEIGGGFESQEGLGIDRIKKYMTSFGFGENMSDGFFFGEKGVVPDREWKKNNFNGEDWLVGNTYHTSIGQYGFQVTPIQVVRAIASIANNGKIIEPTIIYGDNNKKVNELPYDKSYYQIVREGMKISVEEGTAVGLKNDFFELGAKTGTAELGSRKQFVNSWVVGFFPYEKPKYAFAVIMEKGPVTNTLGGVFVMRQVFDWMRIYTPEYLI